MDAEAERDEEDMFDYDDYLERIEEQQLEECKCGAFQEKNGKVIQVADCVC